MIQDYLNNQSRIPILLKENELLRKNVQLLKKASKNKNKNIDITKISKDINKLNVGTTDASTKTLLEEYGILFSLIYQQPSLLTPILIQLDKLDSLKSRDFMVKFLTQSLAPNAFDSRHENILISILLESMEYEFNRIIAENQNNNNSNSNNNNILYESIQMQFLRENTVATLLLRELLKRKNNQQFIDNIVEPACDKCMTDPSMDLEIDPNKVWFLFFSLCAERSLTFTVSLLKPRLCFGVLFAESPFFFLLFFCRVLCLCLCLCD